MTTMNRFVMPVADPIQGELTRSSCVSPALPEMQLAGGMRLSVWCRRIGISKMTAWRWQKAGKLNVIWRYGIPWITAETIQKFFTDDGSKRQIASSGS